MSLRWVEENDPDVWPDDGDSEGTDRYVPWADPHEGQALATNRSSVEASGDNGEGT